MYWIPYDYTCKILKKFHTFFYFWFIHGIRYLLSLIQADTWVFYLELTTWVFPFSILSFSVFSWKIRFWWDWDSALQVDQRIQRGLFLFACTNSCVNPIVYGLFSRRVVRKPHEFHRRASWKIQPLCSKWNWILFNSVYVVTWQVFLLLLNPITWCVVPEIIPVQRHNFTEPFC